MRRSANLSPLVRSSKRSWTTSVESWSRSPTRTLDANKQTSRVKTRWPDYEIRLPSSKKLWMCREKELPSSPISFVSMWRD